MSFKKGNTEQSSKTQLYQTKTVSEKNISGKNNDMTHLLHLNKYFIESNVEELEKYIHEENIYDSDVKTVLNHHNIETINVPDPYNIYPVFYSILFNKNDQTTILSSLIQNGANLNQIYKFEEGPNKGEQHTIFTLACLKNLPNVIKLLIDNPQIYPNFAITPTADTKNITRL